MKWWRESAVWCGMSWCDFKCFVVWIYKIQCSEQFALSVLCSVQCNAVQYCLSVSRIQCTQCSVSVYSVGSVLQRLMQVVFRVAFVKHSVYRVESVPYIVNGVQC